MGDVLSKKTCVVCLTTIRPCACRSCFSSKVINNPGKVFLYCFLANVDFFALICQCKSTLAMYRIAIVVFLTQIVISGFLILGGFENAVDFKSFICYLSKTHRYRNIFVFGILKRHELPISSLAQFRVQDAPFRKNRIVGLLDFDGQILRQRCIKLNGWG